MIVTLQCDLNLINGSHKPRFTATQLPHNFLFTANPDVLIKALFLQLQAYTAAIRTFPLAALRDPSRYTRSTMSFSSS